ncbi:hypothetical protein MMC27_001781 [Xylographa pallens]|nr:hypothetical protein [Xylographa pallens]
MDPLALAASILAVLTAAGTVSNGLKKLWSLKHASEEFLVLMTEVSDLQIVLEEVNDAIRAQGEHGERLSTNLAKLLLRAKITLVKLNKIIQKRLTRTQSTSLNELKVARLAWIIKKPAVRALQEELQAIRLNLTAALASGNSVGISRIDMKVNQVSFLASELRQTQEEHHKETSLVLVQQATMLEDLCRTLAADSAVGQAGPIVQLENQIVSEEPGGTVNSKSATPKSDAERTSYFHTIRVTASRTDPHSQYYTISSDLSLLAIQACSCSRQTKVAGQFCYYFPTWLARVFVGNITPTPELLIRVAKVIPNRSSVFHYAMLGNVDGIKELFAKGLASPFDVAESGSSVLHFALNSSRFDVCKFLLDSRADPFYQSRQDSRPIDIAWDRVLGNFESESTEETLINLFSSTDYLESRQFSIIHKIVLGILNLDLNESLEGSTSEIDSTDSSNRSALSWAAMRADTQAVETLLRHKANVGSRDCAGKTALHYARNESITSLLLSNNASVDTRDVYGRKALHTACRRAPDLPRIMALILAGADINAFDDWHRTPLSYAAQFDFDHVGKYLLNAERISISLAIADVDGFTPLMTAIESNAHKMTRIILASRPLRSGPLTTSGGSLLHIALRSGDAETLTLLAQMAHLIDWRIIAHSADIAPDIESLRTDRSAASPELAVAVEALFAGIAYSDALHNFYMEERDRTTTMFHERESLAAASAGTAVQ